jgi:enediyne biosynthesis protein E4
LNDFGPNRRPMKYIFKILCISLIVFSCKNNNEDTDSNLSNEPKRFQLLTAEQTGVQFSNVIKEDFDYNYFHNLFLYNGGGIGILDVNNDGKQDMFLASSLGECKLYLNEGNLKFKDITASAGVRTEKGMKMGVSIADVNADGFQDIYVCKMGMDDPSQNANLLYINNQNNTFTERAKEYGIDDASTSVQAIFFDYDNDKDLDLYVINEPRDLSLSSKILASKGANGKYIIDKTPKTAYESDRMYKNNGNNTFTDVTVQSGLNIRDYSLSVQTHDFNNDGFIDLYVANDFIDQDNIYINNKNGTFTERSAEYFRHTSVHSMGSSIEDINNDGLSDLMTVDMMSENNYRQKQLKTAMEKARYQLLTEIGYGHQMMRNTLQLNNGNGTFSEIGCLAGINFTDWSWSNLMNDFDNDGYKDIHVTNGYYRDVTDMDYQAFTVDSIQKIGGLTKQNFKTFNDYLKLIPSEKLEHYMYKNNGDLSFTKVTDAWGMSGKYNSNGSVYADLDNDGDLEVIVNHIDDPVSIYENLTNQIKDNNYFQIKLKGAAPNTLAYGASVKITYDNGKIQYAELQPVKGFISSSENILHFGMGKTVKIDQLAVKWPDGKVQLMTDINTNQRLILDYNNASNTAFPEFVFTKDKFMSAYESGIDYVHIENPFVDFDREFLIPHKLSNQGPCMAVGDVNGDGLTDVYMGASKGGIGKIYMQNTNGKFNINPTKAFDKDAIFEDNDAVFFDVDNDKDLDIFVTSGGNEGVTGDIGYQDRLYNNDGKGNFLLSQTAIPRETDSNSKVIAFDYDNDGFQDLIVGGSNTPGQYPLVPTSYIYKNNNGGFSDVTSTVCPEFQKIGMVGALHLMDIDGDKKPELIVGGEWIPITVFKVGNGTFTNITKNCGLDKTNGWWTSLSSVDVDKDGDLDLVGGNLGLNQRLRATEKHPFKIYAKDIDGNGSIDPIMAWYNQGNYYPLLQRDQLIKQLPILKKKYVRYGQYASAKIEDVLENMGDELILETYTFETTLFINNGKGKFTKKPLPNEAQIAPAKQILAYDINNDGNPDLIIVGNEYGLEVETNRIDGGNGTILLGDGKGNFHYVYNINTGMWANREARDIKKIALANKKSMFLVINNDSKAQSFLLK